MTDKEYEDAVRKKSEGLETPEDLLDAYKEKQKDRIAKEDHQLNNAKALIILDKIGRELGNINKELNQLNKILKRR